MANRKQSLFVVLAAIFLTNAILAELIGVKIFSLESTLGFHPVHFNIFGYTLDFNLTAGVVIWPVVFIVTDIINEYFGKKGVRKISLIAVGCIAYAFVMIYMVTKLSPAAFWLEVNGTDAQGNSFDMNYAFNKVYIQGLGIVVGSIIAFLISQFLDAYFFNKIRWLTKGKMVWLRATGSTLISQFIDSFVVLSIAFYFWPDPEYRWPLSQVLSVGTLNYMYKFVIAIALTPFIYLGHYLIDRYLGKEEAEKIKEEAAASRF